MNRADIVKLLMDSRVQVVLSVLALLIMCYVAYWLVVKVRDSSKNDLQLTPEVLKNFEEMRQEGDISEAEYRNIRSVLGKKQAGSSQDDGLST